MIRSRIFLFIVLAFVVVSAALFQHKFSETTTILDELRAALGGLQTSSPVNSRFGCRAFTQVPEIDFIIANAMAPVTIVPNSSVPDTLIYAFDRSDNDSLVKAVLIGRHSIWATESPNFRFYLTTQAR